MKFLASVALFVLARAESETTASPVAKALTLLGDLQAKIVKEGEAAQKVYAEFSEFCEDRSAGLAHDIKTGEAEKAELEALIAEKEATVGSLTTKVEELAAEISKDEADLKSATAIRDKETTVFSADEKELVETIDVLQRAIAILEREMKKTASFAQFTGRNGVVQALSALVDASLLSSADASKLTSLVQEGSQEDEAQAPAAPIYKSQSGDILQTLSDLLDKAETQLEDLRSKETADLHAFELMEQGLKDEIKFGNKEVTEAKEAKSAAGEKKASAESDLSMTTKALDEDVKAKKELKQDCLARATDFELETKSRGEELAALAEAKKVLQETTSGAETLSYGLNQVSFLQISNSASLRQYEVQRYFRDLARKEHSAALSQLAMRVASEFSHSSRSGEDPFAKVKGLIADLIEKLESEAEADATKKAYCDKELAETNQKKAEKSSEVEKLSTEIDKLSSQSAKLKEEVAELQKALAELAAAQAQMDKVRAEEKELFTKSKAELEEGLEGVKLALKVLKEYYAKEDKSHDAADGDSTGIIGLLEVVESDFTKNLASSVATEESAANEYDAESKENAIEKATKEQDVKYKVKESKELDQTVSEVTSDKTTVEAELDAVLEYLKKIEAECIAKAETYEERKARFVAELAGLREGLRILESETATSFVQKRALRGVHPHEN